MNLTENQHIEFKSIWKDDSLKHICAFANSNGGTLLIGINDNGDSIGVSHSKKLLEDIPNKVVQFLGITVEIEIIGRNNVDIIQINVLPATIPISYLGKFYKRSGSKVQEIKGVDLQSFILRKSGKTFDGLSTENANISDIDSAVVDKFIQKATHTNRITQVAHADTLADILYNLNLITGDGKLKNAAVLLFGENSLRFFNSVSYRIGRFGENDSDLKFQDLMEGNIFELPDKIIDVLKQKYLVYPIRYEGLQRIEELEYPEEALREAILNSIIHKDYTGVHTQLSVYDHKLIIWNDGKLPDDLTIEMLKLKHPSKPRNPHIANIFFKAGYIEAWGRGINKILTACTAAGLPEPIFEQLAGGVQITFFNAHTEKDTEKNTEKVVISKNQKMILEKIAGNNRITAEELVETVGINLRNIKQNIYKLKSKGLIQRIGPDKGGYWKVIIPINRNVTSSIDN